MTRSTMMIIATYFVVYLSIISVTNSMTLPNQVTAKPRHTKHSSTTTVPPGNVSGNASAVTTSKSTPTDGAWIYRYVNSAGLTCILLKTDAVVEIDFLLHNLKEEADSFIPRDALVDGNCKNEDTSNMRISWEGYSVFLSFAKTPGGEVWYVDKVEVTVSPDLDKLKGIGTHGKAIKLTSQKTPLIPTPIGKSYSCQEVDIDLVPIQSDRAPKGLSGRLLMRLLQIQPFMYKNENFQPAVECTTQRIYRDETAPIAVGSTLAVAVLLTVGGYGLFRYFKIKNVQYDTME